MNINWYGQSYFKISGKNAIVVIDPYDAKIGLKPARTEADIALVTHSHHDHNNLEVIKGEPIVVDGPGEYSIKGVEIKGIASFHDKKEGKERGLNTIYTFEVDEIKMCHLGDLGQILTDDQIDKIGNVDILLVPIGGVYTIDTDEAIEVVNQIEPRMVIPMHYKVAGLNINLDNIDKFAKEMGADVKKAVAKLSIKKKELPSDETQTVIMEIG